MPARLPGNSVEVATGWIEGQRQFLCGLTCELSRPWRQTPAGRGRMIFTQAWSGQTVAAVAGRRLERGVRPHSHQPLPELIHGQGLAFTSVWY